MSMNEFSSLDEAVAVLGRRGFGANFEFLDGRFTAVGSGRVFSAGELTIVEQHRIESDSDPDDESMVYAIESGDGIRGVLVDGYGAYADAGLGEFLRRVRLATLD